MPSTLVFLQLVLDPEHRVLQRLTRRWHVEPWRAEHLLNLGLRVFECFFVCTTTGIGSATAAG